MPPPGMLLNASSSNLRCRCSRSTLATLRRSSASLRGGGVLAGRAGGAVRCGGEGGGSSGGGCAALAAAAVQDWRACANSPAAAPGGRLHRDVEAHKAEEHEEVQERELRGGGRQGGGGLLAEPRPGGGPGGRQRTVRCGAGGGRGPARERALTWPIRSRTASPQVAPSHFSRNTMPPCAGRSVGSASAESNCMRWLIVRCVVRSGGGRGG
jgi:hypothetical protein